ncbi:proteinase-activated receptor 1-like [Halichoeres trimaculatus]|uniref:proteinase-activated receptor 1-like n=1 Tax=Halichoeres trimaculatus TaxID=147232 RepID=UPI003D9E914B
MFLCFGPDWTGQWAETESVSHRFDEKQEQMTFEKRPKTVQRGKTTFKAVLSPFFDLFTMSPRGILLLVLVCARAGSTDAFNGSTFGRTFTSYSFPEEEEKEDLTQYLEPDPTDGTAPVSQPVSFKSNTSWRQISEEAELFLTGRLSTVFIPSFYTLVFIISVPINICAVLVFVRRIKPKKPASIYMLNLACADLLFAAVLPFKISYHFKGNDWIFGPAMCRLVTAAFFWNMYCSVLLIACISVDRLLAVVYPINSLSWRTPRNAVIACVAMWALSFVGSVRLLLSEQTVRLHQLNITTCHDVQDSQLFSGYKIYFITLCCVLFFLPLIVTVVSYTRVILSLSRGAAGLPGRSHKRRRAVVMALTVLLMFVLCFAPTNCFLFMQQLQFTHGDESSRETSDSLYIIYLVFLCLGSLNCLLDPLVYYFGSSQCQRELSSLLRCQKITSTSLSSSDPSRSSSRTLLKSSRKDSSRASTPLTKTDSSQANLSSQYKKLML